MAGGLEFYKGAEDMTSKVPADLTLASPKTGGGPVEFFKGAEDMGGMAVPAKDPQAVGEAPRKGEPVVSPADL